MIFTSTEDNRLFFFRETSDWLQNYCYPRMKELPVNEVNIQANRIKNMNNHVIITLNDAHDDSINLF